MELDKQTHREIASELYEALRGCYTLPPITDRFSNISIEDAYLVSEQFLSMRIERDNEKVIGKKIGVTSPAVQEMLGVFQPDFGFLTDAMVTENKGQFSIAGQLIQPRAEAEIAFLLNKDLRGPGITESDVLNATECIIPCFEVVDSRIHDWKIKIQDTIADNASCGIYVLGDEKVKPEQVDLPSLEVNVFKNGRHISSGKGSAVQGNPLTAVAWLANTLGQFGIPFKAGEVILSGSLVPLEPVAPGDTVHMDLIGVGSATLSFL